MDKIQLNAPAKINLGLDVVRERPDGYHEVRMVMQMLRLHDTVTVEKTQQAGVQLQTDLSFLPVDDGNICCRAAKKMISEFGIRQGVKIYIEKHIPVAAGMAGGSTDCAALLYAMNRLFGLGLGSEELKELAAGFGADVPFFLMRHTALCEGIGEVLTAVPSLPDCSILIVKPPFGVSTRKVYEQLVLNEDTVHPDIDGIVEALRRRDLRGVCERLGNVLETVTAAEHPVIGHIRDEMLADNAEGALMSGSGPAVFGIFKDRETAKKTYGLMRKEFRNGQVYLTAPYEPGKRI